MAEEKFEVYDGGEGEPSAVEEEVTPENSEEEGEYAPAPDVMMREDPGWLGCGSASVPRALPSQEQMYLARNGELPDKFVIAERSAWTTLGPICTWVSVAIGAAVFGFSLAAPKEAHGTAIYAGVLTGIMLIITVIYTAFCADIPRTIALYENGKIVIWITKKKRVRLEPSDILFISQRNYRGWYRSGRLIVESAKGRFVLSMVADVDEARRKMELIRPSDAAGIVPLESEDD